MGKNLLEKIENKIYWGVLGALLTIAFGAIGLYTYFHEQKPSLLVEIINESNVLDVHKSLENLTIYFDNENIQKKNLNLRIITIQISNNGEVDILQSYYDQKMEWGFKVSNGEIINNARIVNSNSEYLKNNLSPKIIGDNIVELEKVIFEKGKFFSIEILVIHNKDTLPEINYMGKIVGIESVTPVKTWEKNLEPNFWKKFFYGGFLINVLRPIITFIALIALIILIVVISDKIGELKRESKKKSRERKIYRFLGGEPKDEKIKIITDSYIYGGFDELERIEMLINNPDKLKMEINKSSIKKDYSEKIKEIEKSIENDEGLLEETDLIIQEKSHYPVVKYGRLWWHRPQIQDLLEKNIAKIDNQGELKIDPEFKKAINKMVKQFKIRVNKRTARSTAA